MKKLFVISISIALAFIPGCSTVPNGELINYFPDENEKGYLTDFASTLLRIDEPSLYEQCSKKDLEQYRLVCTQSFEKPVIIRISKNTAGLRLRVVRLNSKGGFDGHIEYDETLKIANEQWDKLKSLLEKTSFWDMPTHERNEMGLDGYDWILEGQMYGKYHRVWRWTPDAHTARRKLEAYREACLYLISLSKMKLRNATLVDEQPVESQQNAIPKRKF